MSALVRITTGIMPQHSRVGFVQVMSQFGEVVYCRKPPYSGIPGEDYVNIGFATQSAAEKAYAELKAGRLMVDGVVVGVGPTPREGGAQTALAASSPPRNPGRKQQQQQPARRRDSRESQRRREPSPLPLRANFKQRHDERSPSPRTIAREAMAQRGGRRSPPRRRRRGSSSSSSPSRSRSRARRR
mmetsp:Transcript_11325/g.35472  ORF Transcript_11325/g.35472 Transcript_11325/m.35472 type:complete len:186 (+) Transcript_11325:79-636(+)